MTVSFHYRGVDDEDAARAELSGWRSGCVQRACSPASGARCSSCGPIEADKGTAVQALLVDRGLHRALYAGDDTTDLDGFRGLDGLELAVRVAVASAEGPRNCARPPTWWSTAPLEHSSC